MIAADTNILARAILEDDEKQSQVAQAFLKNTSTEGSLYISPFVLLELTWILKSKKMPRHKVIPILENLLQADGVAIGQKHIVTAALHLYAKKNVSFADCLIAMDADLNQNAKVATFDKSLQNAASHCVAPL